MQEFILKLQNVNEFVPSLAKKFGIGYKNKLGEFIIHIPRDFGRGKVHCINFPNGIGLYWFTCQFEKNTRFKIAHPNINPLRLLYCMEGKLDTYFSDNKDTVTLGDHEHLVAAPRADEPQNLIFKKGEKVDICYIEIDRMKFKDYLSFNIEELDPIFYQIFSDIHGTNRVCEKGSYGLKTFEVIRQINECSLTGFPRINFMGAKALEILSFMLNELQSSQQVEEFKFLKKKDIKAVEQAVEYINANLSTVGTVEEISQEVGINVNKLQEGFQALYGKTVNVYIRDVRLTKALNLLSTGEKNVTEVVYELGLNSRSYFSKIFKKKYGISPRQMLSNQMDYEEDILRDAAE